ncbi:MULTISPECIES: peptidoglycan-binding protein [unclassified Streptomyces]|uniref:peptidoglycan-binding protein n=1 Tax=unclassified Streptomyces TaxID=2593676 RepID=UPI00336A6098
MTTRKLIEMDPDPQRKLNALHARVQAIDVEGSWALLTARDDLADAIGEARGYSRPMGNPDYIEGVAGRYLGAAAMVDRAQGDLKKVAKEGLPAVWVGGAGEKASEVINATSYSADQMAQKFEEVVPALQALAVGIREAQAGHDYGISALDSAASILNSGAFVMETEDLRRAKAATLDGIKFMSDAAGQAKAAGVAAGKTLTKLASEARAGKVTTGGLSDADRLVLADAAAAGGPRDLNEILTANELQRSSAFMDKMSAKDQAEFDRLLSGAKSPQERAYLMKTLAAGYGVEEIRGFAQKINGRSPQWLADHLTPMVVQSTGPGTKDVAYEGAKWWQGSDGTCVAASTVTARAMIDPIYAFRLTTGGQPDDAGLDNPWSFSERLRDEQHRVHTEGKGGPNWSGMVAEGQDHINDVEVGSRTGTDYSEHGLETAEQRRSVLPAVEEQLNNGVPVPVNVKGSGGYHSMMIVGHEDDRLQIYNPFGTTTWVSEDDFINSHMAAAADPRAPEVYAVYLSK